MNAAFSGNRVMLRIAGITVALDIAEDGKRAAVGERYREFMVAGGEPEVTIHVEVRDGASFLPMGPGPFIIELTKDKSCLRYRSYYEAGWLDVDGGKAFLEMAPEAEIENFLRVLYSQLCERAGGLLLHAAGVIRNNQGYVLFGPSGSGKTTATRFSLAHTVLSDDMVIVKMQGNKARVYGVPFRGDFPEAPRVNRAADLHGLFSLVKAPEHRVTTVAAPLAIAQLSACLPFLMRDSQRASRALAICRQLNESVPVRALHFRPDAGFWRVICDD